MREASESLGVSQHSLRAWKKKKYGKDSNESELEQENRLLKRQLERVTKEREILKKALSYFAAEGQ